MVLLLRNELLLVVALRLTSGKWLGNRQHASNPRTKAEFTLALYWALIGRLFSDNLFTRCSAYRLRVSTCRGFWTFLSLCSLWLILAGFAHDVVIFQSFNEFRLGW